MADKLRENPPQRDIAGYAAQEKANQAPEEISNQVRGHKANLNNITNTSEESKQNSEQKLKELGGEGAFFSKDQK
ncbi:hypothetical protein GE09DRAFT_359379 [Coniochaeta sp. 2T2.1]|nr:hypothetical protein GE09DRAFT_359379 [Coniochaeta sp. 2T2.1]